jgi:hypothetical protein
MHLDALDRTILSNQPGTPWSSWNQMIKLFPWGDVFMKKDDVFNLLIVQMPQRYVFGNANIGQRLIRVSSSCYYPIDVFASKDYNYPGDTLTDENYVFSFNGNTVEYNVWISFGHGQRFEARARAETIVDNQGNTRYPIHKLAEFLIDTTSENESDGIPLYEFVVPCS